MKHLLNISVLVLGLGESGLAMARWCARAGATVRVWDSREAPPQQAGLATLAPAATLLRGELTDAAFDGVQLVLKSPGLAPGDARIAEPLARAAERGVLVQGELELFARALADLKADRGYAPKLVAITGTNGKTTTTAMAALLIERAGKRVAIAGNIGPTMLQTLADALDLEPEAEALEHLPEVWVLELSSFQLDEAKGFEPSAATVLNITQDHLDWHGSMAAYVAAKARVFGKDAVMVINRDDALVERLVPEPVPVKGRHAKPIAREVVRFGLDAPTRPGDYGLVVENGMAWLVRALEADETIKRSKTAEAEVLHIQRLMPADALRLRGRHNAANALAALALATAIGCPLAPMLHGLRDYTGEPHRVEYVATVEGVDAFDDSKGTNVGATVAAIDGLGADKAPAKLVVILGGDGKGQDFAPLAVPVQRHARAVATIGRDAQAIADALAATGVPLQRHETLEAATRWAFERAQPGDAVLLSPACASLDMFRNYAHRAEVFVAEVQALAAEHGGLLA
ncbi:UDP-N-acetylmuramoyl-L-alanine--D-glutamate ligase [Piscinibacter sp.]|jgi:UDP-N-acetylmuramoylalanine--D-glutamate ligase|uniref:UDP-N-acetylmuramoyl-L-alanine--D-glutamate ligase n=1 Tax=Piscinibacter sp. TaxID=1903157 RepID=UPI002F410044